MGRISGFALDGRVDPTKYWGTLETESSRMIDRYMLSSYYSITGA